MPGPYVFRLASPGPTYNLYGPNAHLHGAQMHESGSSPALTVSAVRRCPAPPATPCADGPLVVGGRCDCLRLRLRL
eukprot:7074373-Lingulodinium_polyedra.AAC.1